MFTHASTVVSLSEFSCTLGMCALTTTSVLYYHTTKVCTFLSKWWFVCETFQACTHTSYFLVDSQVFPLLHFLQAYMSCWQPYHPSCSLMLATLRTTLFFRTYLGRKACACLLRWDKNEYHNCQCTSCYLFLTLCTSRFTCRNVLFM